VLVEVAAADRVRLPVTLVMKADITEATTAAAFAGEVAAVIADEGGSQLNWYEQQEGLVSAPWHGTQLGESLMARTRGPSRFLAR
jgi:hypothetical protein